MAFFKNLKDGTVHLAKMVKNAAEMAEHASAEALAEQQRKSGKTLEELRKEVWGEEDGIQEVDSGARIRKNKHLDELIENRNKIIKSTQSDMQTDRLYPSDSSSNQPSKKVTGGFFNLDDVKESNNDAHQALSEEGLAYITNNNFKNIVNKVDISGSWSDWDFFCIDRLQRLLSEPEIQMLYKFGEVLEGFEKNIKFNKIEKRSNYERVVFISNPAFHTRSDCDALKADYQNYEIPPQIPTDRLREYRSFFKENVVKYKENRQAFFANVEIKFRVKIDNINEFHGINSGATVFDNMAMHSDEEIKFAINRNIQSMESFRRIDDEHYSMIERYGYGSHRAFFTNQDGRKILFKDVPGSIIHEWHEMKVKLKGLITQYLIKTINPEFSFDKKMLQSLGFRQCQRCHDLNGGEVEGHDKGNNKAIVSEEKRPLVELDDDEIPF